MKYDVVICEDEIIISLDLERILRGLNVKVTGKFSSAEECLSRIKDLEPDLVISDINLSGKMSGLELGKILIEKYNIKVFFITGLDIHTYEKEFKAIGSDYMIKPYDESELKKKIKKLLDESLSSQND